MKTIERGTYIVLGTVDLLTEKVRTVPAIRTVRETPILDQLKDIEPRVRRATSELNGRGEKVADRFRNRVATARRTVEGLPSEARKAIESLRSDPGVQLEQLRTRLAETVGQLKTRGTRKPASDEAA